MVDQESEGFFPLLLNKIKDLELQDLAAKLHKLQLPASCALMRQFIDSDDLAVRASLLCALCQIFTDKPLLQTITGYAGAFKDLATLFATQTDPSSPLLQAESDTVTQADLPDANVPSLCVTPSAGSDGLLASFTEPSWKSFLVRNTVGVRIVCAALAICSCIFGIHTALKVDSMKSFAVDIKALNDLVSGGKGIWSSVTSVIDPIMSTIYNFFGVDYVNPELVELNEFSQKIATLHKEVTTFANKMKVDWFGVRREDLHAMKRRYDEYVFAVTKMSEATKSLFNYSHHLTRINLVITELNEAILNVAKTASGKQRPVTVWFAGAAGVGKTRLMTDFGAKLARALNSSVYPRTITDQYWSGYYNQAVTTWDDLLQQIDGSDVSEFHKYTSEDSVDTVGAALGDKGRPFSSAYILTTSNHLWFAPPTKMTNYLALNRRRDYLVYAHNADIGVFRHAHQGMDPSDPTWWDEHPTKYYLLDPTFGADFENMSLQSNIKFNPNGPYVIREITLDQLYKEVTNMELFRREAFRQRLVRAGDILKPMGISIPAHAITYDPKLMPDAIAELSRPFITPAQRAWSLHCSDIDLMKLKAVDAAIGHDTMALWRVRFTAESLEPYSRKRRLAPAEVFENAGDVPQTVYIAVDENIIGAITSAGFVEVNSIESDYIIRKERDGIRVINYVDLQWIDNPQTEGLPFMAQLTVECFEGETNMVNMSNVFITTKKVTCTPGILLLGPPGIGKTCALQSLNPYVVPLGTDVPIPNHTVLLYDDVTLTAERFEQYKEALAQYYSGELSGVHMILATGNEDSTVWKKLPADERSLVVRRNHTFTLSPGWTAVAAMSMTRKTVAEHFSKCTDDQRVERTIVSARLHAGRDPAFVRPLHTVRTMMQVIECEIANGAATVAVQSYNRVVLATPPNPVAIITLDHDTHPSPLKSTMLVRNDKGEYLPADVSDHLRLVTKFAYIIACVSKLNILDRSQAVKVINENKIASTLGEEGVLLQAPNWKIAFMCVEGVVHAFEITDDVECKIFTSKYGIHISGKYYPYETSTDVALSRALGRLFSVRVEESDISTDLAPIKTDVQSMLIKNTGPATLARNVVALLDIALTFGSAATIFFGGKTAAPIEDEGRGKSHRGHQQQRGDREHRVCIEDRPPNDAADGEVFSDGTGRAYVWSYNSETGRWEKTFLQSAGRVDNPTKPPKMIAAYKGEIDPRLVYLAAVSRRQADGKYYEEYGIVTAEQFVHFSENRHLPGTWTCFSLEVTRCKPTIIAVATQNINKNNLSLWKGACMRNVVGDVDISSLFAHYACFDTLKDFETGKILEHMRDQIVALGPDLRAATIASEVQGAFDQQAIDQVQKITRNVIQIWKDGQKTQYGVMLYDRVGITNSHAPTDFKVRLPGKEVEHAVNIICIAIRNDIVLFELQDRTVPAFPSIMQFIPTREQLAAYASNAASKVSGYLATWRNDTCLVHMANGTIASSVVATKDDHGTIAYRHNMDSFGYTGITQKGDCGIPYVLIAPTLSAKFVSIHARGNNETSMGVMITRDYIESLASATPEGTIKQSAPERHEAVEYCTGDLVHQRCELTGLEYIGTPKCKVYVPVDTTSYKLPFPLPETHEPTIKSKYDPRNLEKRDVLAEGLSRYGGSASPGDIEREVQEAAYQVGNYIADILDGEDLQTRIITTTEAINGAPREEFRCAQQCDRTGSAGYPTVQQNPSRPSKGHYLEQRSDSRHYFRKDAESQKILARTNYLVQRAYQGVSCDEPWIAYSKDEPVKKAKIYDSAKLKTRVYFGGSMPYYLAYRRLYGAALWRITEVFSQIPVKVGINPRGTDWQYFIQSLLSVGPTGFASDMENWDGTVPIEFLRAVPAVYNIIYRRTDPSWTPLDDVARNALHRNVEASVVIMRDRVLRFDHAMTSGFPGTSIENSLINWMLFYCVYRRLAIRNRSVSTFAHFMRVVSLGVFGDDNVVAIDPMVTSFFHFNSFKKEAKLFGFIVTDAAKTGKAQPDTEPIVALDFLQRTTRVDGCNYYGKLNETSINRMLSWHKSRPSYEFEHTWRTFTQHDELIGILHLAAEEYSAHGEQRYDEFVTLARSWCRQLGIIMHFSTFVEAFRKSGYAGY